MCLMDFRKIALGVFMQKGDDTEGNIVIIIIMIMMMMMMIIIINIPTQCMPYSSLILCVSY